MVDALSRREEGDGLGCATITIVEPAWLKEVQEMVKNSQFFKEVEEKLNKGKMAKEKYNNINGVWFYKGKVSLDSQSPLCMQVFEDHHSSLEGGHSGYHQILQRIKRTF